jgi:6-pyruvoyl-tetrahydropterin synthase related domain
MPRSKTHIGRVYLLAIMAAAIIVVIPMILFGNPRGHDFDLHVPAWMETEQQLAQGILFPRWTSGANHGFGAPAFIFYPPLSRTLGALLGLLLPWKVVPGVYVWLVLVLAGITMWKCATEWLQPRDALVASLLYAANPYLLLTAYKRCNYAELLATALFPLLVWGGLRMGSDNSKAILSLAIVFGAIWVTDLPAAVIASYSLAGLLLLSALHNRSVRPLLAGSVAIGAGFGICAFFLFPAAWERRWVNIDQALKFEWLPEHNFLFTHNNIPQYVTFNRGLSFFALLVVIVTSIAAVFSRQLRRDAPQDWLLLTVLAGVSTFMMFPPSLPLYRILPQLRFVEFPWRWLSPLCVAYAVLSASAMAQVGRRWILWSAAAFLVVAVGAVIVHTTWWDFGHRHLQELILSMPSGLENKGATWASPLGSQPSKLESAAPLVALSETADDNSGSPVQIQVEQWAPERKAFSVEASRPLLLKLKLLTYPSWRAKLNGTIVPLQTERQTGQMLLAVPAGLSHVEVQFGWTWDRRVGLALSLITVFIFFPLAFWLTEP